MNYIIMSEEEARSHSVGEAITLSAVLAVIAVAVIAVVVYKLFVSSKGGATVGGWKFSWS